MKPAAFDYHAPASIEDACKLLSEAGGGAAIIAGGQTLMPLLALRMSQPFLLIDINGIASLRGVSRLDGTTRIGSMVRQNEAIVDPILQEAQPLLVTATRHVGHYQTRNRGTVGGSIALGEPAAELPATALALGALVEVCSTRGTRQIDLDALYLGPYATTLEPDEIITSIRVPEWGADAISIFHEVSMRPGDFALVGLAGALKIQDGRIKRAGIAWFGMGPTPMPARQAKASLEGQLVADLDVSALAALAVADTAPFDDHHASAEYRRTVAKRVFVRALEQALHRERS